MLADDGGDEITTAHGHRALIDDDCRRPQMLSNGARRGLNVLHIRACSTIHGWRTHSNKDVIGVCNPFGVTGSKA